MHSMCVWGVRVEEGNLSHCHYPHLNDPARLNLLHLRLFALTHRIYLIKICHSVIPITAVEILIYLRWTFNV